MKIVIKNKDRNSIKYINKKSIGEISRCILFDKLYVIEINGYSISFKCADDWHKRYNEITEYMESSRKEDLIILM